MGRYDTIKDVTVAKTFDEIVEVNKFNPFHDAAGKFSSSNGFKSYSANPNTRAGAMAIARSAAAGHGSTLNVHRDSQGETIRRNANWLARGAQGVPSGTQGSSVLRRVVEPTAGLSGASAAGSSWQHQNQQAGRTTTGGKQPAQKPQQQQQAQQNTTQQQKPQQQAQSQQQAQQQAQQQTTGRTMMTGQDISQTFKVNPNSKEEPLTQVAKAQKFDAKPQLESDSAKFSAAVQDSGFIAYRTICSGTDVVTGRHKTGAQFVDDLKNSDNFSHNGTGGKVYGGGIYIAATSKPVQGKAPSRSATNQAKTDSQGYGGSTSKTVALTLDKSAKIGDYNKVRSEYNNLSYRDKARFGNDMAAYAASKGYDALRAVDAGWGCDYITVYNRSKLVVYDN